MIATDFSSIAASFNNNSSMKNYAGNELKSKLFHANIHFFITPWGVQKWNIGVKWISIKNKTTKFQRRC